MSEGKHHEIERKYLIRYPDIDLLQSQPGCEKWEIVQIYLAETEPGLVRRIRQVTLNGEVKYYKTFKRRLSDLTAEEDEGEISQFEYIKFTREGDAGRRPVSKARYRIPYEGRILEFDVYPFWDDRAILEIELDSEEEIPAIPDYVQIIRDVSSAPEYKNRMLAVKIPHESIE